MRTTASWSWHCWTTQILAFPCKQLKGKETYWLKRATSPLHRKAGTERASLDLKGYWVHSGPEPCREKYSCLQWRTKR
eukprot:scaffold32520_cov17-Tisochrysis_lutea.AAC.1